MNIKGRKIVFLGDSITEGVGASNIENVYWNVLSKKTGAKVKGYGISGTRIAEQIDKSDPNTDNSHFVMRVAEMDDDADIIVIFGGTNDYGHGDAPFGKITDRTDNTFYGAMHNLCRTIIKKYPASLIVVMTPTHRIDEERLINERGIRNVATLSEYVEAQRKVAEYYSIPLLDLYSISGLNPEIPELKRLYMNDGLHPNDLGHELIANRLIGFLDKI